MERLLSDASKISGIKYDISSFADITQAIHVMQEEMNIAGTTAKEAGTTIEGSVNSMKSAWQNLLTGLAGDGENLGQLIDNLMTSIFGDGSESNLGVLGNVLPVIERIISSFSTMIPTIVERLSEHLPELLQIGVELLQNIINGISTTIPQLLPTIVEFVSQLVQFIVENLPTVINAGIQILLAVVQGIAESLPELVPAMVDAIMTIVETLIDNIDVVIDAGIQIIIGLAEGLIKALPKLIEKIPIIISKLVMAITSNFPKLVQTGIELIVQLAFGLVKAIPSLLGAIPKLIVSFIQGFVNYYAKMGEVGLNLVKGIWQGISNSFTWIKDKIRGWVGNVTSFIKRLFGIHSPSTVFRDEIGTNLALGLGEGFENTMSDVNKEMANSIQTDYDLNVNSNISGASREESNYYNMVNAFKQALKDVKIVMDDREMGTFVTNTMERVIYT